jgi:hypothetical protein
VYALRTPRKNSLLDPRVRIRVRQLVGDRTVLLQSCTNKPLRELRVQSGGPSTPRYGSSLTDTTHAEPAASSRTNEPLWELRVQSKAHRRFTLNHLSRMRRTLRRPSPPALTTSPCGSCVCRAAAHRRLALDHLSRMRRTLNRPSPPALTSTRAAAHRRLALDQFSRIRRTLNRPSPPALTSPYGSCACRAAAHRRPALDHLSDTAHAEPAAAADMRSQTHK